MSPLVTNRSSGDDRGDPAMTKRICGFDSRLLLGPVIPKTLKIGSGPCLHGIHDEMRTTKHTGQPGVSIM